MPLRFGQHRLLFKCERIARCFVIDERFNAQTPTQEIISIGPTSSVRTFALMGATDAGTWTNSESSSAI